MKLMKTLSQIFLGLLLSVLPAWAQPTFTVTSLSAAITSTATTMTVASATGFTANTTAAYIGDEMLLVRAVSGTTITVIRGQFGTRATNHGNGTAVYVASPANYSACGGGVGGGPCGAQYNPHFSSSLMYPSTFPSTLTTVGNLTLTAGQVLGGLILRDPNGGARTDTLPTAALLVAAIPGAIVGSSFEFKIRNDADAAETITVAAGAGGTVSGTATIAQNNSKAFLVRLTAVHAGNEAYTAYSLGTVVH